MPVTLATWSWISLLQIRSVLAFLHVGQTIAPPFSWKLVKQHTVQKMWLQLLKITCWNGTLWHPWH